MNLAFRGNWKQGFLGLQAAPKKINGAGHRGPLPRCRAQGVGFLIYYDFGGPLNLFLARSLNIVVDLGESFSNF